MPDKRLDCAVIPSRSDLDVWRQSLRDSNQTLALVPTMGNLHSGHLALIKRAQAVADNVLVSIFVNPTQFAPGEDYATYPRTPESDLEMLSKTDVSGVWLPTVEEVYPGGTERSVTIDAPSLSRVLCGAHRPGHFSGVAGVVTRLFRITQPQLAVFGEKDYQQLLIIRKVAEELLLQVKVLSIPTVREPDGLAISSRNRYLTEDERRKAPLLYAVLSEAASAIRSGEDLKSVEARGAARLKGEKFRPEYFSIRSEDDLGPPRSGSPMRVFAAAWLGAARLIDNVAI